MKERSHLWRHGASAAGTALKGGGGLKGCSCVLSAGYLGHGFALVMLCGWVLIWVFVSTSSVSLAMWREPFKLKSYPVEIWVWKLWKPPDSGESYFPCRTALSFTIIALWRMLLNSRGNHKNGVQKGSGIGGQSWWMPSLFQLPLSASLCNESAQS